MTISHVGVSLRSRVLLLTVVAFAVACSGLAAMSAQARAATCSADVGAHTCTLTAWSKTWTDQAHPGTLDGGGATLQAYSDPEGVASQRTWIVFSTGDLPAGAQVTSAAVHLWAENSAASPATLAVSANPYLCLQATCTWNTQGPLSATAVGSSGGSVSAGSWVVVPLSKPGVLKLGADADTGFQVTGSAPLAFATGTSTAAEKPELVVNYSVAPPNSSVVPPDSSVAPLGCAATMTPSSGTPFCPSDVSTPAAVNQPLPSAPALDPNSAGIVTALNAGQHNADLDDYATHVFNAAAATWAVRIACTAAWGTCPLTGVSVPVNPAWTPSPGSDHAMVVVDYATRHVYDLWDVSTTVGGAISLPGDGTMSIGWGDVTSLDGSGQSRGATGSGLSNLYGMIRVSEAQRAVTDGGCTTGSGCALATAIPHALHFASDMTCSTFRAPAVKSDGTNTSPDCIPEGARVFLDSGANCAFNPAKPIEEAVCFALERYGAFVTDSSGATFAIGFEGATSRLLGGSGPSPYAAGGLAWDYYDMHAIPWQDLHVAAG